MRCARRPSAAAWLGQAVEPLRRAGSEGYAPSAAERRRLGLLVGARLALRVEPGCSGPAPAAPLAAAGPAAASWAVASRARRYRRAVESALPRIATATADALAAGRSVRAALDGASGSLDGPAAAEMSRVRADLDLGAPLERALGGLRQRIRSPRVDSFCAVLLSQRIAGGDLVALLRRYAELRPRRASGPEADARSATAQARFTGLLVAAMPAGAALLVELLAPGFVAGLLRNGASLALLAVAGALQVAGFAAISRLGRVAAAVSPVLAGAGRAPRVRRRVGAGGLRAARRGAADGAAPGRRPRGAACPSWRAAGAGAFALRGNRAGRAGTSRAGPRGGPRRRRLPGPGRLCRARRATPSRSARRRAARRARPRSPSEPRPAGHLRRSSRRSPAGREGPLATELAITVAEIETGSPVAAALAAASRPHRRARAGRPRRGARALAPLRLAARRPAPRAGRDPATRGAAPRRGARGPGRAEDPARGRPRPGAVGAAGDRGGAGRPLGRPLRRLLERAYSLASSSQAPGDRRRRPRRTRRARPPSSGGP